MYSDKFSLPKRRPPKKKPPLTPEMLKERRKVYARNSKKRRNDWAIELTRIKTRRFKGNDSYSFRYPDTEQIKRANSLESEGRRLFDEYISEQSIKVSQTVGLKRRTRIKQATPPWVDWRAIGQFILCREVMNHLYPEDAPWHIDHIVPICGKSVCGLNWHENMQLLPAISNRKKGNRFEDFEI